MHATKPVQMGYIDDKKHFILSVHQPIRCRQSKFITSLSYFLSSIRQINNHSFIFGQTNP